MKSQIRALILEDEQLSSNRLRKLINDSDESITIIDVISSISEAIVFFDKGDHPDLIFADIQLSDGLVFDMFEKYEVNIPVIIITAYSEYAIKAIKLSALDYLLKPVGPKELHEAIEKAKRQLLNQAQFVKSSMEALTHNLNESNQSKRILIGDLNGCRVLNVDDILKCESEKNYTTFYLADGTQIVSSKTLKEYESILSDSQFIRTHKSFLININHVIQYLKGEGGSVILSDGSEVEVSRRKKADLLNALSGI